MSPLSHFGPAERLVLETQDTEQETEGIHVTATSIQGLSTELAGQAIAPDDADYESARQVFLPQIDRRPAAIVRPVDADEVASVVSLAQDRGSSSPFGAAATAPPGTASATAGSCSTSRG